MRRRSSFDGLWLLFLIFFVFGTGSIFPLFLILGLTSWMMTKAVQSSRQQQANRRRTTYNRRRPQTSAYYTANSQSRADLARINVYLRKYFRTRKQLDMPNNIDLVLREETYKSLYSLDVYRDGSRIGTLAEFRSRYGDIYDQMFDTLLSMAINDQTAAKGEVVDAEIVENRKNEKKPEAKPEEKRAAYYARVINDLNDDIPDEEISNGLYESSALLKQIETMEQKFPDSKGKLDKLYQYYLPIQVRILNQYANLQNVRSDPNYEATVSNLKKTIGLVNQAMQQLIADMSDSDFINLTADMSTLEAVLQKDGLAGDGTMAAHAMASMEEAGSKK